ncbi:hypothetical protein K437DRAFT_125161 [Tilletiaria anomala UBC 951]|uniref:Uncharacterized protein n=1 Tax=Tilletiaria anomala (strain ATCC 24038 / CBS 436.72 / UBC 951) TaxID=1037660 RepID=A0A066W3B5_TILAU|nr:uncharacterized protein K437DRAFT_125161 [Tilletiaria anomala UBC 951]KDN45265.1 hypothetical protein K437DRAFT_125161 [Tilletiaria anomala UBC 951]
MIVEPEQGELAELRAAYGSLQGVGGYARSPVARAFTSELTAWTEAAIRSDGDVAALKLRDLRRRSMLGLALHTPPDLRADDLVDDTLAAITDDDRVARDSREGTSVDCFRFFLLCYLDAKAPARTAVRSKLLAGLREAFLGERVMTVDRALWLVQWLSDQQSFTPSDTQLAHDIRASAFRSHLAKVATLLSAPGIANASVHSARSKHVSQFNNDPDSYPLFCYLPCSSTDRANDSCGVDLRRRLDHQRRDTRIAQRMGAAEAEADENDCLERAADTSGRRHRPGGAMPGMHASCLHPDLRYRRRERRCLCPGPSLA